MVLFVTGLCGFHCFYCPVSEEKMYKDVIYADEMPVTRDEDVIEEARAIGARGAGITGGDPLESLDRTCHYIRMLKQTFGHNFHIHLYTMSADPQKIAHLAEAGLDEIRFHPPPGLWRRMKGSPYQQAVVESRRYGMSVGLEVPLLPDALDDLEELLNWAEALKLDFVNLNELEYSSANYSRLRARGYERKDGDHYGVKGSDKAAMKLLSTNRKLTVHYCTSKYKDAWQLRERIKRRAENVHRPWEVVTKDGTLVKGIIEAEDLLAVKSEVVLRWGVPEKLVWIDERRKRLEIAPWLLENMAKDLRSQCYLVEEYPTVDRLEVERIRLF